MSTVNILLQQAGYSVKVCSCVKKEWHMAYTAEGFKSQISPSKNIHYNSKNHWVTSFQFEDGDVYLLDSDLGKNNWTVFE